MIYIIELLRMTGASPDIENDEIIDNTYTLSGSSYNLNFTPDEIGIWDIYTALYDDNNFNDDVDPIDTLISISNVETFVVQSNFSIILEDSSWGIELEDSTDGSDTIITEDG